MTAISRNQQRTASFGRYGTPDKFRVKRTRGVPIISVVACPTCGAQIGEKCVSRTGGRHTNHPARRRLAARIDRQNRGIE